MRDQLDPFLATRQSLLSRLKDWDDHESWRDFFDTYWRLIYGTAIKSGLADVEAQDVVQETVISVCRNIEGLQTSPEAAIRQLALRIRNRQLRLVRRAVNYVSALLSSPPAMVVTAGSGEFLAEKLFASWPDPAVRRLSLAETLGPMVSQCACAYALAILAVERTEHGE